MSWSYYDGGRAEVVRERAKSGLEGCANSCAQVPSEAAAVRAFAAAVDAACEASPGQCVKVNGNGHGRQEGDKLKYFLFNANIEVFDME